jgi:hypothetical protein
MYEIDTSPPSFLEAEWGFFEFLGGMLLAFATVLFSIWFPFILTPQAASKTYLPAFYHYDPSTSHFDNTAWTYGTDYLLAVVMSVLAYSLITASKSSETRALRVRSAGLLLCYAVSVTAGGWAHQHYTTIEDQNTLNFRVLWTICVGTVTAAGGFMGLCATEVFSKFASQALPHIPQALWVGFGVGTTLVCILGGISFQRPACDIFVAGTTQAPPTFFLMGVVACTMGRTPPCPIQFVYKLVCLVGFISNAPLLPAYSLLIQHTDLSLAAVNTLLHSVLLVSWSMQALSLRHFVVSVDASVYATKMK